MVALEPPDLKRRVCSADACERFLESVSVQTLSFGQGFEPVRNLVEVLVAGRLRHARIHVGVLMRFARNCRRQVYRRCANRQASCRITNLLEVLEEPVRVPCFAFRSRTEDRRNIVIALDIGLGGEIQIATIGLRLTRKCVFKISLGLAAFQCDF